MLWKECVQRNCILLRNHCLAKDLSVLAAGCVLNLLQISDRPLFLGSQPWLSVEGHLWFLWKLPYSLFHV